MKSLTDLAADLDVSTEQVLVALRVVAYRAGVDELAKWAAKELEGYEKKDELPAHRQWELTIQADMYNPYQAVAKNVEISLPEKYRKVRIYRCFDGVGRLEAVVSASEPGQQLGAEYPDLTGIVSATLQPGWTCMQARAVFSAMHLKEIVDRARQTALRYCLECEEVPRPSCGTTASEAFPHRSPT